MHPLVLLGGTANAPLGDAVAGALGTPLGRALVERFPDGEVHVRLDEPVRGREVFVVQPTSPPVNDHLVELLVIADACRRAAAGRVTAVVPYFGYARADKRHAAREPITARVVADVMQAVGIGRVVTLDLHTPQIEGFFRVPVESLTAVPLLCDAVRALLHAERDAASLTVVAPDAGRVKMAAAYAQRLGVPVAVLHKERSSGRDTKVMHLVGDVRDRRCLLVDDMVSTGGTIAESARRLRDAGAHEDVLVAATHALLLDDAAEKLRDAGVRALLTTDTVCRDDDDDDGARALLRVTSVAPLLAEAIARLMTDDSLQALDR